MPRYGTLDVDAARPRRSRTCRRSPRRRGSCPTPSSCRSTGRSTTPARSALTPPVAAPVDPALRLVLRRPLPGVAGRRRSRSSRSASSCAPASARAACASARCATRPPPSRRCATTGGSRSCSARSTSPAATTRSASRPPSTAARVVELAVHTADVINGSDLMTFDNLHLVRLGDDPAPRPRPGRPGVHDPPGRPRPGRGRPCPTRRRSACAARCSCVAPIIGFTFRADTDLVPVRFTIDGVRPAVTSTTRIPSPRLREDGVA